MQKMIIALDYDDTYTADPNLWRAFIERAQFRGHTVYIVTARNEELDYEEEFDYLASEYDTQTVFCDYQPKREVTKQLGIDITNWIDDHPENITQPLNITEEQLAKFRASR